MKLLVESLEGLLGSKDLVEKEKIAKHSHF